MKILITGAGGVLGRHLIQELVTDESNTIVASTAQKELDPEGSLTNQVEFIARDAAPGRIATESGLDAVIHAAWPRGLDGTALADGLRYQTQVTSSVQTGTRLINISSQSVYSAARTRPAREEDPLDLDSPYAASKYASELMADSAGSVDATVNVRLASLLSPHLEKRLVNRFVGTAMSGRPVQITGGHQVFDFMDVRDAARAIAAITRSKSSESTPVLNVGAGAPKTLREIADSVAQTVKRIADIDVEVQQSPGGTYVSGALDTALLKSVYGFASEIPLTKTITDIVHAETGK